MVQREEAKRHPKWRRGITLRASERPVFSGSIGTASMHMSRVHPSLSVMLAAAAIIVPGYILQHAQALSVCKKRSAI